MKKIILLCAVVLGFAATASAQTASNADIKFALEKYDFGKIPQGKPVTVNFEFTNSGVEPLILVEARPTCSCTSADYTKTPVRPGQKGVVKITYSSAFVGMFTKSVVVTSNAKTPQKIITILGEVVAPPQSVSSK